MNTPMVLVPNLGKRKLLRTVAVLLAVLLFSQPAFVLIASGQRSPRGARKPSELSEDQRIAHVLSRLTFGARPGDFERVKAMGVNRFISQQFDADTLDDTVLQTKLAKLPTLGLAQTVIFEQYTPPKPTPTPAPGPPKPADNPGPPNSPAAAATSPGLPALNGTSTAMPAMHMEAKLETGASEIRKPEDLKANGGTALGPQSGSLGGLVAQRENAPPAAQQTPAAKPKPTPVPKNPQMVVTELQRAALLRAVYSERQLDEVVVNFWENHFNVFANKDDDRYLLTVFDRDTIRPFALGRFRDLLGATAHSPAMLYYLDNWRSSVARPFPATKTKPAGVDGGLNENYARELMELHTLGVDGGYTQQDVQEVARCFSGWTIQKPNEEGLFLYRPGLHDKGEKVVLGHKIPAGGGIGDGERVLDILAQHPATARFIATKLARRFISDDPPQAVIDRAAAVFLKTDGSIRETLRAIISAPEFFSPAAYRAKLRSPFEYVAAALRALNVETDIDPALLDWTRRMGQQPFGRITPDGYPDRSEQWLTAGAMLARFNFANALASNKIKGTVFDVPKSFSATGANDSQSIAERLMRALLTNDVGQKTQEALVKMRKPTATLCGPPAQVVGITFTPGQKKDDAQSPCTEELNTVVTMLIGSPEFQRR